ncbi:MAG: hypothetical protein WBI20_05475 [Burkholderiaceae bacterium]
MFVYPFVCGCAFGAADPAANPELEHDNIEEGFQITSGVSLGMLEFWPI